MHCEDAILSSVISSRFENKLFLFISVQVKAVKPKDVAMSSCMTQN